MNNCYRTKKEKQPNSVGEDATMFPDSVPRPNSMKYKERSNLTPPRKGPVTWISGGFGMFVQAVSYWDVSKALNLLAWRDSRFADRHPGDWRKPYIEPKNGNSVAAGEWLDRAHVHSASARLIVKRGNPKLYVEAVSQLQQACEKATKGLMIANGMSYQYVEGLQHNTSGAFLELMIHVMTGYQDNLDWKSLDLSNGPKAGSDLIKLIFPKDRPPGRKVKLQKIWDSLFPDADDRPSGTNTDWRWWRKQTSTWSEPAINWLLDGHQEYRGMWDQYINRMEKSQRVSKAPLRPLLEGEVSPEEWVFGHKYAGLSEWFVDRRVKVNMRSEHSQAVRAFCDHMVASTMDVIGPEPLPESVAILPVLRHLRDYSSAMLFLYVAGSITTPHATSSRYPADRHEHEGPGHRGASMGTQDYNSELGIIKCIERLSKDTEACMSRIEKLLDHNSWLIFD